MRAFLGKANGKAFPNSACSAGYKRNFIFEQFHEKSID
jgi:hypothetical protein